MGVRRGGQRRRQAARDRAELREGLPGGIAYAASRSNDSTEVCWFDDVDKLQKALGWVADNGKNQAITYSPEP
jgi:hypothetical protein